MTPEQLANANRRELQRLAKQYGVKANMTSEVGRESSPLLLFPFI
jgi:hypothetical protein